MYKRTVAQPSLPKWFLHINNQGAQNNYKNIILKEPNKNPRRAHLDPRAPLWATLMWCARDLLYAYSLKDVSLVCEFFFCYYDPLPIIRHTNTHTTRATRAMTGTNVIRLAELSERRRWWDRTRAPETLAAPRVPLAGGECEARGCGGPPLSIRCSSCTSRFRRRRRARRRWLRRRRLWSDEALNETTALMKLQVEVLWKLNDTIESHETLLVQHQKHASEFDERLKSVETLLELRHVPAPLPPPAERAPSKVHVLGPRDREPNSCSKLSADARELLRHVALERLPPCSTARSVRTVCNTPHVRPLLLLVPTPPLPSRFSAPHLPRVHYRAATPIVLSLSAAQVLFGL